MDNELIDMFAIFDEFGISKENQKIIIEKGITFDFAHGREQETFGCYKVARFLKFCKLLDIAIDANAMVRPLWDDQTYREVAYLFNRIEKLPKNKTKRKTK